ncbi:hypothetical protein LINGRAHAP2_LOCUS15831 [Linum grandiflorum]
MLTCTQWTVQQRKEPDRPLYQACLSIGHTSELELGQIGDDVGETDGRRIFKRRSGSSEKGCLEEEGSREKKHIKESLQRLMYFICWALS